MKILLIPGNWFPQFAGGEHYLARLIQALIPYGHEFKGISIQGEDWNGIEFAEQGDMQKLWVNNNEAVEWCDVIFTQLLGSSFAYNKSNQHKKPMVFIAHNTSKGYMLNKDTRVVYNSQTLANMRLFPDHKSTVRTPLVPPASPTNGTKIALINCNLNKGAELFNQLASELPYQFLGIKGGYGEQILSGAVEYVENSPTVDWSDIKLLLVPSDTESWSQVASEAIMRGIPVITTPLAGVRENLSYAGIYIDRNDVQAWKVAIGWLMDCETTYRKQSEMCLKRAGEFDNNLDGFNDWLLNK